MMSFDYSNIDLPVVEIISELEKTLSDKNTVILNAPPGAGKSTLLPLVLMDAPWLENKKIIVLEPRRLAAKSIAQRLSQLLNEPVGNRVGYRIRFETKVSNQTKVEVVTEGILTRMMHSDNSLEEVGLIIFDEFHERSIHADVSLALSRELQQILRPELRILIMSATLDMPQLSELLNAPVIVSKGRQYPIDIKYEGGQDMRMIAELSAKTIIKASKEQKGDILVFLPGQREIKKCEDALRGKLGEIEIHPLYGKLPPKIQQRAIQISPRGKRKVILATSIAETSLTIQGVSIVVDSGLGRTSKFDPKSGLSRLETVITSKDSADQRAGRAGRLGPGHCYRMWTLGQQSQLQEHRTPEILETDLSSLVLDLAHWGINDAHSLTWLTPPPQGALTQAYELLHDLGALENNNITAHGKKIHQLPCNPRLAHMLIKSQKRDLLPLATDLAAILEERDPFYQKMGIDINLRIEALRRYRQSNGSGNMHKIEQVADSYRRMFKISPENTAVDDFDTGFLLAYAFPERIAYARPGNNAQFQLSNGNVASFSHKDDLAHEPWLVVANLNANKEMGNIFLASKIDPTDLQPLLKKVKNISWNKKSGRLSANLEVRIGRIILSSTPLPDPDSSEIEQAICKVIKKDGEHLLNFDNNTRSLLNRINSLGKWNPDEKWPNVSIKNLCISCEEWLSPYLSKIKKGDDLKKLDLIDIIFHSLDYDKQQALNNLAPTKIEVPSGSNITIQYQTNGETPVLAVRLQECFGLEDTPTVNNGKKTVLMHLLSPGFKPVQITSDLKNFWSNTYFEVRKEIKGRYPKHHWPENPMETEAVRGVKKRKRS